MSLRTDLENPSKIALVALTLIVLPACQAAAKDHWFHGQGAPAAPYVANRPNYAEPNARPLFFSTYAGYGYPTGARPVYTPSGMILDSGQYSRRHPLFHWFNR